MGRVGVVGGVVATWLVCALGMAPLHAGAGGLVAAENIPLNLRASAAAGAEAASTPSALPEAEPATNALSLIDELAAPVVAGMAPAPARRTDRLGSSPPGGMGEPDAYALVVIGLLAVGAALLRHSRNRQSRPGRLRR